jgi:pyruvate dehydrogenase E2 component (dihydrolipoamide acetyltransferase)
MDVLMPQLGETVAEGKITRWFKQAGDEVRPGDNLFEIETDKTSMEVPSTAAGTLTAINFQVGEVAKVGAVVAVIGGAGEKIASKSGAAQPSSFAPAKAEVRSQSAPKQAASGPRLRGGERGQGRSFAYPDMDPFREVRTPEKNYGPAWLGGRHVTPLARRLAGEHGIDLANINGSGPHGRIVAGDIETVAQKNLAAEARPATHLYLVADIEIERLLALCAEANAAAPKNKGGDPAFELSIDDFLVKAWATALQRAPAANAGNSRDIGVVVALDDGSVTPIIRNAEAKSLTAVAAERRDLVARVHGKTLKPADLQGGSSTISNLGMYGVREFAPIINPGHTTALAVGAVRRAPAEAEDGSVKFVSMLTAALSCDHRIVDVAAGAQLLATFKTLMENPLTALI